MTVEEYIASINKTYRQGNATEHSYRGGLQQLLATLLSKIFWYRKPLWESLCKDCGRSEIIPFGEGIISRRMGAIGRMRRHDNSPGGA